MIFSGFDDFEYAKQAVRLNVSEYILKPINAAELTAVLQKLKTQLDTERTERQNVELLRSREEATHTKGDIHEVDTDYLALCRRTALRAADCLGWHKVPCVDEAGNLRSAEEIHRSIWAMVAQIIK